MKMPEPMIAPLTIIPASNSPSFLFRPGSSFMGPIVDRNGLENQSGSVSRLPFPWAFR